MQNGIASLLVKVLITFSSFDGDRGGGGVTHMKLSSIWLYVSYIPVLLLYPKTGIVLFTPVVRSVQKHQHNHCR